MAKKEDKPKVVLERTYNIPLRKEFLKVPRYKRSKKAIAGLRKFLSRHMKSDNIKLGKHLNELIWQHGIRNPPHHVQVTAIKDDQNVVRAELIGKPIFEPEPIKEEKKGKKAEEKKETETKPVEEKATEEVKSENKAAEASESNPVEAAQAEPTKEEKPKRLRKKKAEKTE